MPQTFRSPLQHRVTAVILDAAARVFAAEGEQASMHAIADEAGVGRATLYRYFPNRPALLAEVADVAVDKAAERLRDARLDRVGVDEGVRRAIRALLDVGDYFMVLARERTPRASARLESAIGLPLRQLLERGQSTGVIRSDIPSSFLTDALISCAIGALASEPTLGVEDVIAATTSLLLDGARVRTSAPSDRGAGT